MTQPRPFVATFDKGKLYIPDEETYEDPTYQQANAEDGAGWDCRNCGARVSGDNLLKHTDFHRKLFMALGRVIL